MVYTVDNFLNSFFSAVKHDEIQLNFKNLFVDCLLTTVVSLESNYLKPKYFEYNSTESKMIISFLILEAKIGSMIWSFALTRNRGGIFWIHRKIGCLNFEPQYLLNYSSPKNDLYSVRKRSIRAFKSIFKLLGWGPASLHWLRTLRQNFARLVSLIAFQHVSTHATVTLTQSWYQWDKRATNENWKNGKSALNFWSHFLDFGDITSIFCEMACNAM